MKEFKGFELCKPVDADGPLKGQMDMFGGVVE